MVTDVEEDVDNSIQRIQSTIKTFEDIATTCSIKALVKNIVYIIDEVNETDLELQDHEDLYDNEKEYWLKRDTLKSLKTEAIQKANKIAALCECTWPKLCR